VALIAALALPLLLLAGGFPSFGVTALLARSRAHLRRGPARRVAVPF
jgi:hypothetical protein